MKTHTSPAIIMRIKEFGESDLLVTFFTPDQGRLKGVAKGARKSRKRFVNCLDSFSLVDLGYSEKREGDLSFLHSGKLIDAYPGLRSDFGAMARAGYMVELVEILFPWGVADREMFELLKKSLASMAKGEKVDLILIIFELGAMVLGGYGINFDRCCICERPYKGEGRAVFKREKGRIACLKCQNESALCPGLNPETVRIIKLIQSSPVAFLRELSLKEDIVSEIKPLLKLHREYHIERKLKTARYVE
ncbi:MAG: DNA repair protein RecO [Thermodesulfobacteriota bacterium]|nr:DNA repair protein RecO [Thermodesulfobacteriota bacterium]